MNKQGKIISIAVLVLVALVIAGLATAGSVAVGRADCKDHIDNDGDGFIDWPSDPGCSSKNDNSELNLNVQCDDGIDNSDADTLIDYPDDAGCASPTDNSEINGDCDDRLDNDGDGAVDYLNDPGCASFSDSSELGSVECDDGLDNDGDSRIDLNDVGCSGLTDNDETNCGDGVCEGGETQASCPADCGVADSCTDTDGGFYIFTQGTVSGSSGGSPFNLTDFCINSATLNEYQCNINQPVSFNVTCPGNLTVQGVCVNGACA